MIYGVWQSFDSAAILLSQAGFPLIAKPVVRGSFAECIAVDPNKLQTKIPEQLGYPLCTEHGIIEGLVVRPVRGRMSGEARKWIKNKSWHFLEERPNELAKSLREPEDFRRLYLHLCVRPRLDMFCPTVRSCAAGLIQICFGRRSCSARIWRRPLPRGSPALERSGAATPTC